MQYFIGNARECFADLILEIIRLLCFSSENLPSNPSHLSIVLSKTDLPDLSLRSFQIIYSSFYFPLNRDDEALVISGQQERVLYSNSIEFVKTNAYGNGKKILVT